MNTETQNATLTEDDTQPAPVLKTRAIINADFIHGYAPLYGSLVQYRHIQSESRRYLGRITTITENKFGIEIYVEPLPGQGVKFVKPYHMNTVKIAWFEVAK